MCLGQDRAWWSGRLRTTQTWCFVHSAEEQLLYHDQSSQIWFLGMVGKEVGEAVLAPAGDLFVLELGSENKVDGLLNGCLR